MTVNVNYGTRFLIHFVEFRKMTRQFLLLNPLELKNKYVVYLPKTKRMLLVLGNKHIYRRQYCLNGRCDL